MHKKIAIIGGGPAGIFSALLLKNFPGEIHFFEQNKRIGEKLRLTGGGRMNITNAIFSEQQFSSSHPQLLKNLFKSPWIRNREAIFKELEIEYVWEKNRAILKSGDAFAEVERLTQQLEKQKNIFLHRGEKIEEIQKQGEKFVLYGKDASDIFDAVILATGGMFRLKDAGTEKDLYRLALQTGHTITTLSPSLSPLSIAQNPFISLAGTSFTGKLSSGKYSVSGDILFTHQGLSGPAVLDFSSYISQNSAQLSFISEMQEDAWHEALQQQRQGKYFLRSFLKNFLPQKLVDWHLEKLQIPFDKIISDLKKETVMVLKKQLFHFPLENISCLDYPFCWTTKGGIPLTEIHISTLESKFEKNLFFAGEVLDVNGFCGGYNISFAAISAKIIAETLLSRKA